MPQRKSESFFHPTLYRLPPAPLMLRETARRLKLSGTGAEGSAVRLQVCPAYQAPHPEKPMACRTVRRNCAPKMKKKAIKLNELSDLQRKEKEAVRETLEPCIASC